jgi:antitoxin CptB
MVVTDAELRWSCRRGMLELDLILSRFLTNGLSKLTPVERAGFARLLTYPDPDLFYWLMGQAAPDDLEIAHLVATIRAHAHV